MSTLLVLLKVGMSEAAVPEADVEVVRAGIDVVSEVVESSLLAEVDVVAAVVVVSSDVAVVVAAVVVVS